MKTNRSPKSRQTQSTSGVVQQGGGQTGMVRQRRPAGRFQEMANASPQVTRLRAVQQMADGSHPKRGGATTVPVVQRVFLDIESGDFKGYVTEQEKKQGNPRAIDAPFTTVGFEHEFTQTEGESALTGISHLELAKARPLPFTGLPFILETDAANALELVSPPFLIKTLPKSVIPDPTDVESVDHLIRASLERLAGTGNIANLIEGFGALGIPFRGVEDLKIEAKNVSHKSAVKDYTEDVNARLDFRRLGTIPIKPSEKGGGITSQVNFATDAKTFDDLRAINKEDTLKPDRETPGYNPKAIFATLEADILEAVGGTGVKHTPNLDIFIRHLARTLSGQFAVPAIKAVKAMQEDIHGGEHIEDDPAKFARFRFSANLSSLVKDVHGVWIKDSLMNIGLGILTSQEWEEVKKIVHSPGITGDIGLLELPEFKNINGFESDLRAGNNLISETLRIAKGEMIKALGLIYDQILWVQKDKRPSLDLVIVPTEKIGFMEHHPGLIGPRQDTYIDPRKAHIPGIFPPGLQVVETRKDGIESLYQLGLNAGTLGREALLRLQAGTEGKVEKIMEEIEEIREKREAIGAEREKLKKELSELDVVMAQHEGNHDAALEAFKERYAEEHDNKPPGKKPLKDFEKGYEKKGSGYEKRKISIGRLLEPIPVRIDNTFKEVAKKIAEAEGYLPQLEEIEKQLASL